MILNTVCEKENLKLMRIKENYYIKILWRFCITKTKQRIKKIAKSNWKKLEYMVTLKEVKEAIIKEMIKDEVNHRKTNHFIN